MGIPIVTFTEYNQQNCKYKIVVTTASSNYVEIKRTLLNKGYQENIDFCILEQFLTEWYWKNKQKACIFQVDTAVTSKCTLKCKNCNMFTPYYKEHFEYTFSELKETIDLFFDRIDYLFNYNFLGGEPFLNADLSKAINYIHERYMHKVGCIGVSTNGTVLPDKDLLKTLLQCHVHVTVTNYTKNVDCSQKLKQLIMIFDEAGIIYAIKNPNNWKNFGFIDNTYHCENTEAHMQMCAPLWHGLNDKKFYYCNVAWSGEKSGLFSLNENDYIDLTKLQENALEDKKRIVEHSLGCCNLGYISFCSVCHGCGKDNTNMVLAGQQL